MSNDGLRSVLKDMSTSPPLAQREECIHGSRGEWGEWGRRDRVGEAGGSSSGMAAAMDCR